MISSNCAPAGSSRAWTGSCASPSSGCALVIASRIDPGLSLQRLRSDRRLSELRFADLALSPDEARQLFELSGLELATDHVAKLHERTEGWVGGLSLAALSLRGHPDPDAFVRSFTGDERTVADYLIEEVLERQPAEMRNFMLRTSVVDELEPGLAAALTGRNDAAQALALLELLARTNAFLMPLDQQGRRYRYHPLFQELLRSQLRYRMPDAHALTHRRAARWFAAHGPASTAVRHALAAGDFTVAAELVSSIGCRCSHTTRRRHWRAGSMAWRPACSPPAPSWRSPGRGRPWPSVSWSGRTATSSSPTRRVAACRRTGAPAIRCRARS